LIATASPQHNRTFLLPLTLPVTPAGGNERPYAEAADPGSLPVMLQLVGQFLGDWYREKEGRFVGLECQTGDVMLIIMSAFELGILSDSRWAWAGGSCV